MCGPKQSRSGAKLGVEDAMILMTEMNDFRLLEFIKEEKETQNMLKEAFEGIGYGIE